MDLFLYTLDYWQAMTIYSELLPWLQHKTWSFKLRQTFLPKVTFVSVFIIATEMELEGAS